MSNSNKDKYSNLMHKQGEAGGQVPPQFCRHDIDFNKTSSRKFAEYVAGRYTTQKISELEELVNYLHNHGRQFLKSVVEIGTFKGGTLWMFSQLAAEGATIVSIDLPGGDFGGGSTEIELGWIKDSLRKDQKSHFIRKSSQELSTKDELVDILGNQKIDLLFIDGDHSYEGVQKDTRVATSKVKNGGVLVFNDYMPWSIFEFQPYGVMATANQLINKGWSLEGLALQPYGYFDVALRSPN